MAVRRDHRLLASVPSRAVGARRGVDQQLVIAVDGVGQPECRDVPLTGGALAYSTQHQVSVGYSQQDGA